MNKFANKKEIIQPKIESLKIKSKVFIVVLDQFLINILQKI